MKYFITIAILSTVLFSCKESSNGPCDYNKYESLAKVKAIEPYTKDGKELYHVILEFNSSSLSKEDQFLDKLKNIEIDSTFLKANKIRLGFKYQALVSEIIDGNCTPLFVSIDHKFIAN